MSSIAIEPATIVTAFYPLERSKHSLSEYLSWIKNLFLIPRPMVVYTNAKIAPLLERIREGLSNDAPFLIIAKELTTYDLTTPVYMEFWQRQWLLDPEARIHNPELYAVWAIKQECVALTIKNDPLGLGHNWYAWCDCGIQRHPEMQQYYNTFTDSISRLCAPSTINFLEVGKISDAILSQRGLIKMPYPPPRIALGAGCIVGDRTAWATFSTAYIAMLDTFQKRGWFAGKEQDIIYAMFIEKVMPFRLFFATRFGKGAQGDPWMSFPVILGGQAPAIVDTRFVDSVE